MNDPQSLLLGVQQGDIRTLARSLSLVENDTPEGIELLRSLSINYNIPIVGITGPPGAGKSTLVNGLVKQLLSENKKVAVVAVDPSSPFNFGALLGDRIRLNEHFNHPNLFIRSLASRGSLGGLSAKIIEVTDVLRSAPYDYILVETVGVGQSEVEIAGLADVTIVVLVPEAGDEIQVMKAGIMEIADIFAVNKADRPEARAFAANLKKLSGAERQITVVQTIATAEEGIPELIEQLKEQQNKEKRHQTHLLLAEKAFRLIQHHRMKDIQRQDLQEKIATALADPEGFNLYVFIDQYF